MAVQTPFTLHDVAEALVMRAGYTEGIWLLTFNFNFTATMLGPVAPTAGEVVEMKPGVILQVAGMHLVEQAPGTPLTSLMVDASALAGRKGTKKAARGR